MLQNGFGDVSFARYEPLPHFYSAPRRLLLRYNIPYFVPSLFRAYFLLICLGLHCLQLRLSNLMFATHAMRPQALLAVMRNKSHTGLHRGRIAFFQLSNRSPSIILHTSIPLPHLHPYISLRSRLRILFLPRKVSTLTFHVLVHALASIFFCTRNRAGFQHFSEACVPISLLSAV